MRAYFFGNMYLSSIQQGIQAAHCLGEMFLDYEQDVVGFHNHARRTLYQWAEEHKTMILLNGGYSDNLREVYKLFDIHLNPYPYGKFHEGEDSLDGALTCVGIVLPQLVYDMAKDIRRDQELSERIGMDLKYIHPELGELDITPYDHMLACELNKYGLAS